VSLFDLQLSRPANGRLDAVPSGEIDLSTVADLESRLEQALEGGSDLLVVDLREVTFLDSSGLRLLLRLDEHQRENGRRLVLVQGGRRVARVFELTGAGERLAIVEDPAQVS
jgi:anti-anti-sigma factor